MTSMLIGADWKAWMIDFSRAIRAFHKLLDPRVLPVCDRQLPEKMRRLEERKVLKKTKHVDKALVKPVMARQSLLMAYYEKRIAEKGENAVLY
jgi:hypothetical protein